jgi:hypothetical protein
MNSGECEKQKLRVIIQKISFKTKLNPDLVCIDTEHGENREKERKQRRE